MQRIWLDQHAIELLRAQQNFKALPLVGFSGVKLGLRDRHAELPRVEGALSEISRGSIGTIDQSG